MKPVMELRKCELGMRPRRRAMGSMRGDTVLSLGFLVDPGRDVKHMYARESSRSIHNVDRSRQRYARRNLRSISRRQGARDNGAGDSGWSNHLSDFVYLLAAVQNVPSQLGQVNLLIPQRAIMCLPNWDRSICIKFSAHVVGCSRFMRRVPHTQ